MRISEYSKRVKTHKTADLLFMLETANSSLEDLRNTLVRTEDIVVSLEEKAATWAISKSVVREAGKVVRVDSHRPYFNVMSKAIANAILINKVMMKYVSSSKEKLWSGPTLTFKQAAVLDAITAMENWIDYTYLSLDVLLSEGYGEKLSKADMSVLTGTLTYYTTNTITYLKGPEVFTKDLESVADVEVSEDNEGVIDASDRLKTKLTSSGIGIHRFNPKFWFDLGRSRYDLGRLESLGRYNEQLNMMINLAESKKNGENNPQLEHQIETFRDMINRNRDKQEEIVRRYE